MKIKFLFLTVFLFLNILTIAATEDSLNAAFIRDRQLWIKAGDKEIQITKGRNVSDPKWSYDGRFIAYSDGNRDNAILYIYDTKKKESYMPYPNQKTRNYKWSPISNRLAYSIGGLLNITRIENDRPYGFENVSLGVSDFEWFPNGREFLVSAQSNLLPSGWQPIQLFKVPADANSDQNKIQHFYTIQSNTNDFFAIDAGYFKWSPDGKWVCFLATPTASLSNDTNTLCALSSTGLNFQKIGNMLGYNDWFKWSSEKTRLAYIYGEGRYLSDNKKTAVVSIPNSKQQRIYSPGIY